MRKYILQVYSVSNNALSIIDISYEDFLTAVLKCTQSSREGNCIQSIVFKYPDMKNPICVAKSIR